MVDLVNRTQVLKLLSDFEGEEGKLTTKELEIYTQIKVKYVGQEEGSFDDKTCLEVMLRNISIRQGFGMHKSEANRQIDLEMSSEERKAQVINPPKKLNGK